MTRLAAVVVVSDKTRVRSLVVALLLVLSVVSLPSPASAHTSACVGTGTFAFDGYSYFSISVQSTCVGGSFSASGFVLVGFCPALFLGSGTANGHHSFTASVGSNSLRLTGQVDGLFHFTKGLDCVETVTQITGYVTVPT